MPDDQRGAWGTAAVMDPSGVVVPQVILATDGTVVPLLERCFGERLRIARRRQAATPARPGDHGLELEGDEAVLRRSILLRGARSGCNYLFAESAIVLDRVGRDVREGLLRTDEPIGRLLLAHRVETLREILDVGSAPAGELAPAFALEPTDGLLHRTYRVVHGGRPIMRITERLPERYVPQQAG